MKIYCCQCEKDIKARLTNGKEAYPHRKDLYKLPFWICDTCKNFVGCHHKVKKNPPKPLGVIATKEVKNARQHIHALIDPVWESKKIKRSDLYKKISKSIGYEYHNAEIRSIEQARDVYRAAKKIIEKI